MAFMAATPAGADVAADDWPENKILWRIDFDGNATLSSGELTDAIASTPSSHLGAFFGFFFGGRRLADPLKLRADRRRIEHLYRRKGYYHATVGEPSIEPCSGEGRVCVRFHVAEGSPTRLSAVTVRVHDGHPDRSPEEMSQVFGMKTTEIFDHDRYLAQKKTIGRYLQERGYPVPLVKGDVAYRSESNTAAVTLDVNPGWVSRLGDISFDGLTQLRPEDLVARLPIATGQPYDPRLVDESKDLLTNLDVFRTIDVQLAPRQAQPDVADVKIAAHEKPLKSFQFGGGLQIENDRQEAKLTGEWTNRNFYRHLRVFDVKIEPRYAILPSIFNRQESGVLGNAEVSLKQPGFLDPWQDLRTVVGLDSDLQQGYAWYGPRLGATVNRSLSRQVTLSWGYTFRYLTFYDVNLTQAAPLAPGAVPAGLLFAQNYRLGYFSQSLRWDLRDDAVEPHRGSLAQISLDESSQVLGSGFTYARFSPELRHYFPITKRSTLALKAYYGRIVPLTGTATPITERYYGGGANDHRGFAYHRLSPQVLTASGLSEPIGGNEEILFSGELRVELFELFGRWFIGAAFADLGDVVVGPPDLDLGELHAAVGPGVRYDTPLGVIRADVGFRLNRTDAMTGSQANPDPGQLYAVHVSFGESF